MTEKMHLDLARSIDQQSNWGKLSHGSEAPESAAVAFEASLREMRRLYNVIPR